MFRSQQPLPWQCGAAASSSSTRGPASHRGVPCRKPILVSMAALEGSEQERLRSPAVKLAAYHYFREMAEECRGAPPSADQAMQPSASVHLELLHA